MTQGTSPPRPKPAFITAKRSHTRRTAHLRGSAKRAREDALIEQVAPEMPPCIATQAVWVGVLKVIQADPKHPAGAKPLTPDGRFNFMGVDFCEGCKPEHKAQQGPRCRPDWYKDEDDEM